MKTDDGAVSVPREMQFYEAWVREHLGAWASGSVGCFGKKRVYLASRS
jgi:hypothetical protein